MDICIHESGMGSMELVIFTRACASESEEGSTRHVVFVQGHRSPSRSPCVPTAFLHGVAKHRFGDDTFCFGNASKHILWQILFILISEFINE